MNFDTKNTELPKFFAVNNLIESLQSEFDKNKVRQQVAYHALGAFASEFHSLPDENLLKTAILSHQIVFPLLENQFFIDNSINEFLTNFIAKVYFYCTDFIINLANILGLSYYEINFFIFCVVYPVLLLGLFFTFCIQKIRLKIL